MARVGRIALVSGPLDSSDAMTYAENLARGLTKSGALVRLVAPGGPLAGRFEECGAGPDIFPLLGRRILGALDASRAASRLRGFALQVVHAQSVDAWHAARRIARALRLPLVATVHRYVERPSNLPWRPEARPLCIAVSESLRENLVNEGGMPKSRVRVTPVGLDLSLYATKPRESGPHVPVVGCIARLEKGQGVECFIRAASRVLGSGKVAEFAIAGDGPLERELRRLAITLGCRTRLAFLGGKTRPAELIPNMDVLVMPAPREALGFGILQAMACARPVVAAGAGGVFDLVRDGHTGFLVPPRDEAAIAEKTVELISNGQLASDMGRAGRELVERRFRLDAMTQATEAVYADAVAEHTP